MEDWLIRKIKNNTIMMEACNEMSTSKYYQGKINAFRSCLEKYRDWKHDEDMTAKADATYEEWVNDNKE